jgi:7-cyano-7-deazaguanine synthase in queuosine biosynthesis
MEDGALQFDKCSKEFVALFNQLSKMGSDWSVILSIKDPRMSRTSDGSRSFIDAVEPEKLFQHVFFENTKLQCVKAVVQFGLYTRGPVG